MGIRKQSLHIASTRLRRKCHSFFHVRETCNTVDPKAPNLRRVLESSNLGGSLKRLLLLDDLGLGLGAHDATTPLSAGGVMAGDVSVLDGGDELGELRLVLGADLGEGNNGSGLSLVSFYVQVSSMEMNLPSCGQLCRDVPCP